RPTRPAATAGALLLAALLALAACDSPAEKAEAHYQRALALVAEGDAPRAMIEFRNALRIDAEHPGARLAFARLLVDRGDPAGAMSQLERLVEHDRKNLEAQRMLADLALEAGDSDTAATAVTEAFAIAPADPAVRALKAAVDFRKGGADRAAAVAMAAQVVAEDPAAVPAQLVLVADRLAAGAPEAALALLDAALVHTPGDEGLHLARLATLDVLGDAAGTGAELSRMAGLFPENAAVRAALVDWHRGRGETEAAEAVLRAALPPMPAADGIPDGAADGAAAVDPGPALTLVRFLAEARGPEAARAELDRQIAAAADPLPFRRARAALDFAAGDTAAAIAAMRALIAGAAASDATRALETGLAGMLAATGEAAEAQRLVDAVLAADRDQVGALKLRAKLALDADRPEAAVQDMRTALAQAPGDPEALTVMALAYERQGARELAGEQLARAVEAADRAPAESLRYAGFLMQDERTGPAEAVVVDALRRAPDDPDLLQMLGEIQLARRDWARAGQVAALLQGSDDPAVRATGAALEARRLAGQGRTDETLALLEALAGDGGDAAALAALVRARLEAGDAAGARASLAGVLRDDPANPPARLLLAGLDARDGDAAAAEAGYRGLVAGAPGFVPGWRALADLLAATGRGAEAAATLDAGLEANPGDGDLMFARAGIAEAAGDREGAIALYEALYARDTGAPVVANNLASLIATTRGDPASVERAFGIARRLRGSDVPPFQDTYGWLLHLRGDPGQALDYLAPAAEAMPGNAEVQFHRAEAEFALERLEAAKTSYDRALAAAAAGSPLPEAATARSRLAAIAAAAPTGTPTGTPEAPGAPAE
ncbi:MAG TPA: tetratricopeptide repeat protein, partial [Amaricoccus sp.]|nr:tetratricopeptide repeat protein [Amaricoccus sp.]